MEKLIKVPYNYAIKSNKNAKIQIHKGLKIEFLPATQ